LRSTFNAYRVELELRRYVKNTWEEDFEDCYTPTTGMSESTSVLKIQPGPVLPGSPTGEVQNYEPYLPLGSIVFEQKTNELDQLALDAMIPELDDGFSMPDFLWELFELKFLWADILRLTTKFPELIGSLWSRPLDEIARAHLSVSFGWIPFVNDVKTIVSKFLTIADKVDDFIKNSGKRRTLHFQKALSPLTFQSASWFSSTSSYELGTEDEADLTCLNLMFDRISMTTAFTREVTGLKYHATMDYTYTIPQMEAGVQQFLAEMDVWGINLSPSDIWQEIPFSFVVDWIFKVGPWLEGFDKDNLPVQVVIHDFCRSYKYRLIQTTKVTGVSYVSYPNNPYGETGWYVSPGSGEVSIETSSYYRRPGIPVPSATKYPNLTLPSGKQLALGASLLWTKSRSRHRRRRRK